MPPNKNLTPTRVQPGRAQPLGCIGTLEGVVVHTILSPEEREYWTANFSSTQMDQEEPEAVGATAPGPEKVLPAVFDSHFDLDRTLSRLCLPADGTMGDILQAVPVTTAELFTASLRHSLPLTVF